MPCQLKTANRVASLPRKMILNTDSEDEWTELGDGGVAGAWWQTERWKVPSLVWKWGLRRADMIKYLTFSQNARGCLDICRVLCSYLASLKHMGNQHAHIISGNMALWSTHTVLYLKEKSNKKSNW